MQALLISVGWVLSDVPFDVRSRAVQTIKRDVEKIAKILDAPWPPLGPLDFQDDVDDEAA
jgi:hypothetical protein